MKKLQTFLVCLRLGLYMRRNGLGLGVEKELQIHGFNKETIPAAKEILEKLYKLDSRITYSRRYFYSLEEVMEELLDLRQKQKRKKGVENVAT